MSRSMFDISMQFSLPVCSALAVAAAWQGYAQCRIPPFSIPISLLPRANYTFVVLLMAASSLIGAVHFGRQQAGLTSRSLVWLTCLLIGLLFFPFGSRLHDPLAFSALAVAAAVVLQEASGGSERIVIALAFTIVSGAAGAQGGPMSSLAAIEGLVLALGLWTVNGRPGAGLGWLGCLELRNADPTTFADDQEGATLEQNLTRLAISVVWAAGFSACVLGGQSLRSAAGASLTTPLVLFYCGWLSTQPSFSPILQLAARTACAAAALALAVAASLLAPLPTVIGAAVAITADASLTCWAIRQSAD